jgi:hypothetical protein
MKKTLRTLAILLLLVFGWVQSTAPLPAQASRLDQASSGGLAVSNAILNLMAQPGQVYTHAMLVSSGAGAQPMDIQVDVMGFGEGVNGEFIPLPAESDKSPYSARAWITQLSQTSFHLDPGAQQQVDATLTIPQDPGSDTRYAIVYIHSAAVSMSGQNGVGQILAVSVPVIVTPAGAAMNQTGLISDIKIPAVEAGKPIQIQTTVKNTGNRHFKVKGTASISDASGKQVTDLIFPLTSTSIFPTFTRDVVFSYSSLDHPEGLQPGKYSVDIKILREDDNGQDKLVDEKQAGFDVTQPYTPFAGVDAADVDIYTFNNQEPGTIDASAKSDLKITFEGTGPVTGSLAVVKYRQEPQVQPAFEDQPGNGGMGGASVKFVGIRTMGFTQGIAHVSVYYRPNELPEVVDAGSLFQAYHVENGWRKLDNLEVQQGSQLVKGDIGVVNLESGATLVLGGEDPNSSGQQANLGTPSGFTLDGTTVLMAAAALGGLALVGVAIFLVAPRARRQSK